MSNPLLRPNDPRFQKPALRDEAGQNRFGDDQPADQPTPEQADLFATAASDQPRPYQPRYEAQQPSRVRLLVTLATVAWVCGLVGTLSLTGFFELGWLLPLLGIGFSMTAWLLAHQDLETIKTGAIDPEARPRTRHAYWLGLMGLLICVAVVVAMIWQKMSLLPDLW